MFLSYKNAYNLRNFVFDLNFTKLFIRNEVSLSLFTLENINISELYDWNF